MKNLANWYGLRCLIRSCPFRVYNPSHGIGGQCTICGKVSGFMTNKELADLAPKAKP